MVDLLFEDVLLMLSIIHVEFPDLKFSEVVQGAVDISKRKNNVNLFQISSKELLVCLEDFQRRTRSKRGGMKE